MKHERATLPTPVSSDSFWHSEPNEFLIGHRTTEDLPAEADIVIVGSGITGASAARYLSEDERAVGKSIVLLEAREACWGATGRVSRLRPLSNLKIVEPKPLAHIC
jgi:heterodisulfide reductase subunit A-like polyferredoxin